MSLKLTKQYPYMSIFFDNMEYHEHMLLAQIAKGQHMRGWYQTEIFARLNIPQPPNDSVDISDDYFITYYSNFISNSFDVARCKFTSRTAKYAIKVIKEYCAEVAEYDPSGMGKIFKALSETTNDLGFHRGFYSLWPGLWV